jgi:plastocyanin
VRGAYLTAVAAACLLVPADAMADEFIDAAPSNRYTTTLVEIEQGERVVFRNNDIAAHDVTAEAKGADGKPLFSTPLINRGEQADVAGAEYLTTGEYTFFCTAHQNMKGTVRVNTSGTPKPRPGTGGPGGGPAGGDAPDETAPAVGVSLMSRVLRTVRSIRAVKVRVRVDEAAKVVLRAIARPRAGGPLVTIARATVSFPAGGTRRVDAALTRKGRRVLRKRGRRLAIVVRARAVDAAGNARADTHGRTLSVGKRKR